MHCRCEQQDKCEQPCMVYLEEMLRTAKPGAPSLLQVLDTIFATSTLGGLVHVAVSRHMMVV